ncbi:hypothetical protein ACFYTQ_33310 [Nocardia sp. NPDC004068]|uniref:hypothetical protein n=1 Tax=Nocardia sp. NPDC004068 TaxID=3364303 RepID=UPI0036C8D858
MTITPDEPYRRNRDQDPTGTTPEWAPMEPLPSSEMFLLAFAGLPRVIAPDLLDPAADLVQCQRECRVALRVLSDPASSAERMKTAAGQLVSARADIDMLITVIDEAVAVWLARLWRHGQTDRTDQAASGLADGGENDVVVHTESVGDIVARMAGLWDVLLTRPEALDELPEVCRLCELSAAYDYLAAEIESGRRIPPGL